ncbi:MAG: hypothetical protein ACRERS_11220, partial [Methylococcales bacterium]
VATLAGCTDPAIKGTANCIFSRAVCGHFDPGPNGNSSPDGNRPYHLGDLVNLVARNDGTGKLKSTTQGTLSTGGIIQILY